MLFCRWTFGILSFFSHSFITADLTCLSAASQVCRHGPFTLPTSKPLRHPYQWLPIIPLPNLKKTWLRAQPKAMCSPYALIFQILPITSSCYFPGSKAFESACVKSLASLQAKHFSFANISLCTNPRCSHRMLITVWLSGSFQPTVSRQTCLLHSPCVSTLSLMITPNHGENPQMGCVFMQLSQR